MSHGNLHRNVVESKASYLCFKCSGVKVIGFPKYLYSSKADTWRIHLTQHKNRCSTLMFTPGHELLKTITLSSSTVIEYLSFPLSFSLSVKSLYSESLQPSVTFSILPRKWMWRSTDRSCRWELTRRHGAPQSRGLHRQYACTSGSVRLPLRTNLTNASQV